MNAIMKLTAVAIGAIGIAGGAAMAQTGSTTAGGNATPDTATPAATGNNDMPNNASSDNSSMSTNTDPAPSPRPDRN